MSRIHAAEDDIDNQLLLSNHFKLALSVVEDCASLSSTSRMPDAEFIQLCAQHAHYQVAFDACLLDDNDSPRWPTYEVSSDAIRNARPMTLAGLAAKARAAKAEALMPSGREVYYTGSAAEWAWDLVNDVIQLDGGAA